MRVALLCLLVIISFLSNAQTTGKSILFQQPYNWGELIGRATEEKKAILVVCYTTWCTSCHAMDMHVFLDKDVIRCINEKYVVIKVQIDSTNGDNENTKRWYEKAKDLQMKYKINVFPTYLFFNADGTIIHRDYGFLNPKRFVGLAAEASDTNKQFYTLINKYLNGVKDFSVMPLLANTALKFEEKPIAIAIARDYIDGYLLKLKEDEIYTKENVEFLASFIQSSCSPEFLLFYRNPAKMDIAAEKKGFSQEVIDYIISREEVTPILSTTKPGHKPNWKSIRKQIETKYDLSCARRNVLFAKVRWYSYTENWRLYTRNLVLKVKNYGVGNAPSPKWLGFFLNNAAWEIFLHSNNKGELRRALSWSDSAVKIDSNASWIDTYANLTYKLGNRQRAIRMENKAVQLDPNNQQFNDTKKMMEKGKSNWIFKSQQ